jgi:drug/metabolite transporter (DMT)-like permease/pimeloyl-ACP methyl ester carboxylesterase
LLAALLFGLSTPLAKSASPLVQPGLLAGLLYLGSGIGLGIYSLFQLARPQNRAREASLKRTDAPWLAGAILAGGVVGPLLLMWGLAQTPASSASLLLNLEGVFTALLAWFVFKENFDVRIAWGMPLIATGGACLSWIGRPESGLPWGALAIVGACLAWAVDNNLTRKVSAGDPVRIAMLKGLVAGSVNAAIGLLLGAKLPDGVVLLKVALIGFFGYGISLDIHFIHVRSKHENALPLIVTHGWPGSIIEQLKIVDPLTNPTAHGASESDAFHLVIPSMPGYGFSGKPTTAGWDPAHMARAWVVLMKRLGYERFVAQGGDWGAIVVDQMGVQAAPELLGIHTNMAGVVPPDIDGALFTSGTVPPGLQDDERRACEQISFAYKKGHSPIMAFAHQMGLRPQTLYGLADSPVGLAAYLLDHDAGSLAHISTLFVDGRPFGDLTRDDILDNITLTWLTNTGISSARLYWENKGGFFTVKGVKVPVAVSVFPEEIYQAPRSWAEKAYPKLIHYNQLDRGGHFAAWEQPKLFCEEVRVGLKSLRGDKSTR